MLILQMSTEIAKSFTSKDLAETFPRQIAALDFLHETTFSQPKEVSVPTTDSDIVKSVHNKPNVLSLNTQMDYDLSHDDATGPLGHQVDPVTQLLGVMTMDIASSDYSITYSGMIPPTGLVFGDPLPWSLPSDIMGFLDTKDIFEYTESQTLFQYQLDYDAESGLLINIQELELQFPTQDIFPAAEPFFV